MLHYHRTIISWFFIFSLFSSANSESKKNHAGPSRPYSADLASADIDELKGLDETTFSKLSPEDPLLKRAYHFVFLAAVAGNFHTIPTELHGALSDMRRRGDAITPMLLKLMNENQETGLEICVLVGISNVGNIDLEPYLHYARKLLRERTQSMSAGVAGTASILLASEGNKEDAALMKWVMESRPWLADSVTRELDSLNRRLGLPKQESRPSLKDRPPTSQEPSSEFQSVDQNAPALADKENPETIRWIGWSLALLVTGGLFGLMFKKRK